MGDLLFLTSLLGRSFLELGSTRPVSYHNLEMWFPTCLPHTELDVTNVSPSILLQHVLNGVVRGNLVGPITRGNLVP